MAYDLQGTQVQAQLTCFLAR